jgi:hypothetical protein
VRMVNCMALVVIVGIWWFALSLLFGRLSGCGLDVLLFCIELLC